MALPLPFDTQGLPTVNAILQAAGGGDVGAYLRAMGTALPGVNNEEAVVNIAADGAAHTLVTAPVGAVAAYYDIAVQPDLTDYAAPEYRRVRFKAPGPATANSKWYSSSDGTFRLGPLAAGETISCWVDAAEPAAVDVSYARVV